MSNALLAWLLTYLLHSSILLGLAWLVERAGWLRRPRLAETVWRVALYGGVASASVQVGLGLLASRSVAFHTLLVPAPLNEVSMLLAGAWLVPALLAMAYIGISVQRLNATPTSALPAHHDTVSAFVERLCLTAKRKISRVRLHNDWPSPVVLPNSDICVPEWVFERLTQAQREAMLAHEVAHVVRRDPSWRIAASLVARFGFLQPMNQIAIRRLELLAELSADDWAARVAGQRGSLTEALYTCAQAVRTGRTPPLAPAMASPMSPLMLRIVTLLEGGSMFVPSTLRGASLLVAGACMLFAAAITLPAVAIEVDVASSHVTIDAQAGKFSGRLDGDILFNASEDNVQRITKPLRITEVIDGHTWAIDFLPGQPARSYAIDGTARPLDQRGRAWLGRVIPQLLRETGWDAPARAARLFRQGGAPRVLDEISRVHAGHPRGLYLRALFGTAHLPAAQLAKALELAPPGDRERALVYVAALRMQSLDRQQLGALLASAGSLHDADAVRDVLVAAAAVMPADPALVQQYRQLARKTTGARRGQVDQALDHLST